MRQQFVIPDKKIVYEKEDIRNKRAVWYYQRAYKDQLDDILLCLEDILPIKAKEYPLKITICFQGDYIKANLSLLTNSIIAALVTHKIIRKKTTDSISCLQSSFRKSIIYRTTVILESDETALVNKEPPKPNYFWKKRKN